MISRSLRFGLLAGVAFASWATVAHANGWSGFLVFGDRWADSGSFPSFEAATGDTTLNPAGNGDGRERATELDTVNGGRGEVFTQILSRELGFGDLDPSNPAVIDGSAALDRGTNYAGFFNSSSDVRASVSGLSYSPGGIIFGNPDGTTTTANAPTTPGFLQDADREGWANNALVFINGGMRDVRGLANVDTNFANTPGETQLGLDALTATDFRDTFFTDDVGLQTLAGQLAAQDITSSIEALDDAGAGLIIVPTLIDTSRIPEAFGDVSQLEQTASAFQHRLAQSDAATSLVNSTTQLDSTLGALEWAEADLASLISDGAPAADITAAETAVTNAQIQVDAASIQLQSDQAALNSLVGDEGRDADGDAIASSFTLAPSEYIFFTEQRDLAIAFNADPEAFFAARRNGTTAYNDQLIADLSASDANVLVVDHYSLFNAMLEDPARFGFSSALNQARSCQGTNSIDVCDEVDGALEGELFFSGGQDPTQEFHQVLAGYTTSLVAAPAAVAGIPFVGIGGARSITAVATDQVETEQLYRPGLAPFAAGFLGATTLDEEFGADSQEARHYSGLVGARYSTGTGLGAGIGIGYQEANSPGGSSSIDYDGGSIFGTVFAGMDRGGIRAQIAATYGDINYDADRVTPLGGLTERNSIDADGRVWGATVELGARLYSNGVISAGPMVNFSHFDARIDGFTEGGSDLTAISVGDLEGKSTRAGLGFFVEAGHLLDGQGTVFRGSALYGYEFQDDDGSVTVTPNTPFSAGSFTAATRGATQAPLELGAELVVGVGGFLITTLGYSGTFGDSSIHSLRLSGSYPL